MRDKIIRIQWSDPMTVDEMIRSDASLKNGLYYISRVLHGRETSLYIGKATNTIRERLRDHKRKWLYKRYGRKYVRVGEIIYPHEVDDDIIDHAESALIYEHRDVLKDNTAKTKSYSYWELYQIHNIGNPGVLKPVFRMHDQPD